MRRLKSEIEELVVAFQQTSWEMSYYLALER